MSLTESIYDALKKVLTMDARIELLSASVERVSRDLENYAAHVNSRLENHAERLARLEGKFELLENTLSSRRRRLPK